MYSLPDPFLSALLNHNLSPAQMPGTSQEPALKHMERLQAQGWLISLSLEKTISLLPPYPYHIIPEAIAPKISTPLYFCNETGSTNSDAKTFPAEPPFVLMTRSQTAGKGRGSRVWSQIPDQDLALSYVWQGAISVPQLFSIIRLSALAVHEALTEIGCPCLIKWPNDIICPQGRKICGILSESMSSENSAQTLVIGIGINGNGENLPPYAQSAAALLGHPVSLNALAASLITKLERFLADFPTNEDKIIAQWEKSLAWKGEKVLLEQGDRKIQGIFLGCGKNGSLLLDREGKEESFFFGDLSGLSLRKL